MDVQLANEAPCRQALARFRVDDRFLDIFRECCGTFGIDPARVPQELLAVKGYGGIEDLDEMSVVIVTAGGAKLRYPIDDDTETKLRQIFGSFKVVKGKRQDLPLPERLSLPAEARNGLVPRA